MEIKELGVDKNIVTKEYLFDSTDIKVAERRTLNELNRKYTIEGFRKGKVPLNVFKMRFGRDFYDYFVFEQLVDQVYKSFKDESNLLLIPEIVEKEVTEDKGRIVVNFHKKPVAKVNVESIKVRVANKGQVLSNYLDLRLKSLQEEHAILDPKDGQAEYEDLVRVKVYITNKDSGKVLIDGKEDEYVLYKEDERPTVQNVIGHKKGDVVEFDKEFTGKDGEKVVYHYKLEILEVYKRNLPEITDEFVKDNLTELHLETLDELKNKIMEEGTKIYDNEIKNSIREQILAQLSEVTELFISEKTIDYAVRLIVNNMKEENKYEEYVKKYENEEKALESLKEYYVNELKKESAIEKLAKEYKIEEKATDEELEKYAEMLAPYWGISVERAKVLVKERNDIRNEVENMIFVDKVLDKVAEKVQREIVDVNKEGEESEENN
ncbi:trigger factor [Thermosipho melanesiensis]|uniref:Trigger factor n=2 Tax=Thermosipho melanesiensis TaxID=46541 RepID=A6LLP3_THEM4|nr:trigger factor [Thermosipho melanesiensis]ABR30844.1 trigger factor, C-terminal domain protein [Thermosipho melanesiensis BI429]APT73964.1 trigger factor [Thermosipho melanesiensis]OOC35899.1 trigger factor [Thermosipho melanesiensis]OOC38401.1 trigger factor [Thermosipho melanesiensis]OOC38862.1 trigger factor [Thermosipho melanesiensis]